MLMAKEQPLLDGGERALPRSVRFRIRELNDGHCLLSFWPRSGIAHSHAAYHAFELTPNTAGDLRLMQKTMWAHEAWEFRNFRDPPSAKPCLMIHFCNFVVRAPDTNHLSVTVRAVEENHVIGLTAVIGGDRHLTYEAPFNNMPRDNAGRMSEVTGVANQKCLAINVDLNVTLNARSRSVVGAVPRYSLEIHVPAATLAARDEAIF